jgi:hypothetical protein
MSWGKLLSGRRGALWWWLGQLSPELNKTHYPHFSLEVSGNSHL